MANVFKITNSKIAINKSKQTPITIDSVYDLPVADDGNTYLIGTNWYYWSNTMWVDGGVYQAQEIADGSITPVKTTFMKTTRGKNLAILKENTTFNNNRIVADLIINDDGSLTINSNTNGMTSGTTGSAYLSLEFFNQVLEKGKYTFTIYGLKNTADYGGLRIVDLQNNMIANIALQIGDGAKGERWSDFTLSESKEVRFYMLITKNFNESITIKLQIEKKDFSQGFTDFEKACELNVDNGIYSLLQNNNYNEKKNFYDFMKIKDKYRYLVTTFSNMKNKLVLLGSNDLKNFNLIKGVGCYTNFVRDPSVIQIDDYYYIVHGNLGDISNYISITRTKDFINYEALDDLLISPDGTSLFENNWAPSWYKENDKYYICVSCNETSEVKNFHMYIIEYDPKNHTLSNYFNTQVSTIDCHLYKENGTYYFIGGSGSFHFYKASEINGAYTRYYPTLPTPTSDNAGNKYEAAFAIKLDNAKWRMFIQGIEYHQHMCYYDMDLETGALSDIKQVSYDEDTLNYIHRINKATYIEYSHWTIFDFSKRNDNNNNYID